MHQFSGKEKDLAAAEFVALVAHQLRTPLSAVRWHADMLWKGDLGELSYSQREYVGRIVGNARRMADLVNSLLNVSRLESGAFVVEPVAADVAALVRKVIEVQQQDIEKKKLRVSTKFAPTIPHIPLDTVLFTILVQNIFANAVAYTPEGGSIAVEGALQGDAVVISVADTGLGIPKEAQDKIFTKLFRADNVKEQEIPGTGLGLYIVKSILERVGGSVWFDSEENKGTTFRIALPVGGMQKREGRESERK